MRPFADDFVSDPDPLSRPTENVCDRTVKSA